MTANICPLCKRKGDLVKKITVDNSVKDYFRQHLKAAEYYLCLNEDCNIVYFNNDSDEIYFQRDLKS